MKSGWAKRMSLVSQCLILRSSDKNYESWKLRSDLQIFSTWLRNSRKREQKEPERPCLGEMGDLGSDKDSLCSAQVFRGEPAVSIPPALAACSVGHSGVCWVALAGTWQLFPGAYRGFALCHVALAPSTRNTPTLRAQGRAAGHLQILGPSAGLGSRQWGSRGWVMHSRQGRRLCKSCENPALNAPALSVGARQTRLILVAPSACHFPGLFLVGITAGIPKHCTLK